ncbi:PsbP-related protein [Plebeiibacterium sediminum]|uniref:Photosystem II reaction center PsbP family protein n=1 Tax=Plebeiibacterium sediminum TaxID=2992112 RepID=A0AAE3M4Q7_9BACT|nr:PsbP-related protein [Plebeiobacterium sediminum]MCW3787084.1 photosystem II reaction center PsbP family protein [Plebeiobacterium sediminum]
MKPIFIILCIAFILCIDSMGQTGSDYKSFAKDNYSISYPGNWEVSSNGQMGTSFIILSPLESDHDKFRENVNLMIQDLSRYNIDLNEFVSISEGQLKTMITNGNLISSERVKAGKSEYHKVIYTGDQDIYKLKFEQYYWVDNKKAYILTLSCETNQFDTYQSVGENILNSFKFN